MNNVCVYVRVGVSARAFCRAYEQNERKRNKLFFGVA